MQQTRSSRSRRGHMAWRATSSTVSFQYFAEWSQHEFALALRCRSAVTNVTSVQALFFAWSDPASRGFVDMSPPSTVFVVRHPHLGHDALSVGLRPQDLLELRATNAGAVHLLATTARSFGISQFVHASSSLVYQRSDDAGREVSEEHGLVRNNSAAHPLAMSFSRADAALGEYIGRVGLGVVREAAIPPMRIHRLRLGTLWGWSSSGPGFLPALEREVLEGHWDLALAPSARQSLCHIDNAAAAMVAAAHWGAGTLDAAPALWPTHFPHYAGKGLQVGHIERVGQRQENSLVVNVADGMPLNPGIAAGSMSLLGFDTAWQVELWIAVDCQDAKTGAALQAAMRNGSIEARERTLSTDGSLREDGDEESTSTQQAEAWPVSSCLADVEVCRVLHPLKLLLTWHCVMQGTARTTWKPLEVSAPLPPLPPNLAHRMHMRAKVRPGAWEVPSRAATLWADATKYVLAWPAAFFGVSMEVPRSMQDTKLDTSSCVLSLQRAGTVLGYTPAVPPAATMLDWVANAQSRGVHGGAFDVSSLTWLLMACLYIALTCVAFNVGGVLNQWCAVEDMWLCQRVAAYAWGMTLLMHERQAAYVHERALAWGCNARAWWLRALVFGYPTPLWLHAAAGKAHAEAGALLAAFKTGTLLEDAAAGQDVPPLEADELNPPGSLAYINLVRCSVVHMVHMVLTDLAGVAFMSAWASLAPSSHLATLAVRAVAFAVLELAVFGPSVLFW